MNQSVGEVIKAMHEWAEHCDNPVELALEYAELLEELKGTLALRMGEVTRGYDPYAEQENDMEGDRTMIIQVKIEHDGNNLVFDCDYRDYNHLIWLLEMAWEKGYDTYIRDGE